MRGPKLPWNMLHLTVPRKCKPERISGRTTQQPSPHPHHLFFVYILSSPRLQLPHCSAPSLMFVSTDQNLDVLTITFFTCGANRTFRSFRWPGCDRHLPACFHTLAVPPPPSHPSPSPYSSLGNHRLPGWRQPACLTAGQPA